MEFGVHEPEKITALRQTGIASLVPEALGPKVPSFHIGAGVGRKGGRDAVLDKELSDEVIKLAAKADEYFDSLKVTGRSKTLKTPAGHPRTVTINLVNERIQTQQKFEAATGGGNVPSREKAVSGFIAARKGLGSLLEDAVEMRLASGPHLDADGD